MGRAVKRTETALRSVEGSEPCKGSVAVRGPGSGYRRLHTGWEEEIGMWTRVRLFVRVAARQRDEDVNAPFPRGLGDARHVKVLELSAADAPVPYIACSGSNGSRESAPIHQPNFGSASPQRRYGESDASRFDFSRNGFQV